MNKIIVGIAIIILIFLGAVWARGPNFKNDAPSIKYSKGYLSAYETSFDFGLISTDTDKVSHIFNIKNTGNEPIIIEKIYTSCECAKVVLEIEGFKFGPYGTSGQKLNSKTIKAIDINKEVTAEVIFYPSFSGPRGTEQIKATIILENNTGQPLEFKFTAIVMK